MTKNGFIVRWDAIRAFGFIRSADSAADIFFHLRDYRSTTPPRAGLALMFEETQVEEKDHVPWRCARLSAHKAPPATSAAPAAIAPSARHHQGV